MKEMISVKKKMENKLKWWKKIMYLIVVLLIIIMNHQIKTWKKESICGAFTATECVAIAPTGIAKSHTIVCINHYVRLQWEYCQRKFTKPIPISFGRLHAHIHVSNRKSWLFQLTLSAPSISIRYTEINHRFPFSFLIYFALTSWTYV